MKIAAAVCSDAPVLARSRFADFAELSKPRLNVLVLFTVAAGFLFASQGIPDWALLVHTLVGTALVASGASALNQLLERDSDALMQRTERRPLPSGRLQPAEALVFGLSASLSGILYLVWTGPGFLTAGVAAVTLGSYVLVYTPLKRKTSLNTLVGAVPGALPPLIGYAAARHTIGLDGMSLFLILFLWQVPHFLSIAWIYREDYERGGQRMLSVMDRSGMLSALHMVCYCIALLPASLLPFVLGRAGLIYLVGALVLGLGFLTFSLLFLRDRSLERARDVLRASLIYLPMLLALLLLALPGRAPNIDRQAKAPLTANQISFEDDHRYGTRHP
jgi:protoheme IX farnesyltransferase